MHILILFNQPTLAASHPDAAAEHEVLEVAGQVELALAQAGHEVSRLGISRDPRPLLDFTQQKKPDVVFNLFEGTAEEPELEIFVAGLLGWLHIPFTGCPPRAMLLAQDKVLAKHMLQGAGLPTAGFFAVEGEPISANPLGWPVIVKAARQHASVGLDQGSVVTCQEDMEKRIGLLLRRYGSPVLVEQFLGGAEYNVGVVESPDLRVLPIAEIIFQYPDSRDWPLVTYEAKWCVGSADDLATRPRCPAVVEPALAARLNDLAGRAFRLFGCRDYARIDFRLDERGALFILEVNPNPDLHAEAGLARALKVADISPADFALRLVQQAAGRRTRPAMLTSFPEQPA